MVTHIMLPLFFAASGFTFSLKKAADAKVFFIGKLKRLVIPYIALIFMSVFISSIPKVFYGKTTFAEVFVTIIKDILTAEAMWYLACLFVTECMMFFVVRIFGSKDWVLMLSGIVSLTIGFILLKFKLKLWFQIDVAFISYPILLFGFFIKKYVIPLSKKKRLLSGITASVFYLANIAIEYIFGHKALIVGMYGRYYPHFPADIIQMAVGIYAVFALVSLMRIPKFMACYGRNTLFYYGFHTTFKTYLFVVLSAVNPLWTEDFFKSDIKMRIIYAFITIGVIIIMIPFCYVTNQVLPWIVGKTPEETNAVWLKKAKKQKENA